MAASEHPPRVAPEHDLGEPTVIVDDVHLVYRVIGRHSRAGGGAAALRRLMAPTASPTLREIHAVRGVSLIARRGEAIGLIGPNGSGKSTLLRAVAGLMTPTSGAIYTQGQPSLLGVSAALMKDMTGERNIVLGCLAMGMSLAEANAHIAGICEFAGIGEFVSLPMSTYSSGMAARLRFAIAAAKPHEVLLIDEALATGDADFRRRSEARIRELREAAGTVFLVSHGLQIVRDTCDRAIWLERGTIIADGEANAVVAAYEARHDPDALAGHLAAAAAAGSPVTFHGRPAPTRPSRKSTRAGHPRRAGARGSARPDAGGEVPGQRADGRDPGRVG